MSSVATFIVIFIYSLSGAMLFLFTRTDLFFVGNTVSTQGMGLAPGVITSRPSDVMITDSTGKSKGLAIPFGSLPTAEEGGWHLPIEEHDSAEEDR